MNLINFEILGKFNFFGEHKKEDDNKFLLCTGYGDKKSMLLVNASLTNSVYAINRHR